MIEERETRGLLGLQITAAGNAMELIGFRGGNTSTGPCYIFFSHISVVSLDPNKVRPWASF